LITYGNLLRQELWGTLGNLRLKGELKGTVGNLKGELKGTLGNIEWKLGELGNL
jgi:hypothetical protein